MQINDCSGGTRLTAKRRALHALLAFLAVCAMAGRVEVAEGLETGSALLRAISALANSFSSAGWADVLAMAAIYLGYNYAYGKDAGRKGWTVALSFVFAGTYLLALNYGNALNLHFFFANTFQRVFSLLCLLGWQILFYLLLRLFYIFMSTERDGSGEPLRHIWRRGFIAIFICWLPWILMNYPCTCGVDGCVQVYQGLGLTPLTNHHPVLSTVIIGGCIRLGRALIDINFGCWLYVLLQTVTGALIFSYCIATLTKMGLDRRLCLALLAFYALTPMWGCFAQWIDKDFLYAELVTLAVIYMAQAIAGRALSRRAALLLSAAVTLSALLRNNGIYELLPALLLMLLWLKGADRRRLLAAILAVVTIYGGVTKLLWPAMGVIPGSIAEALSVPFQQTALYVNRFDEQVTDEEKQAIDDVLVYDKLDEYDPLCSDNVKFKYRGDNSKLGAYFKVWGQMFLKHPGTYAEAFLMQCFGYTAPVQISLDAYIFSEDFPDMAAIGVHRVFGDMPTRLFDSIRELSQTLPVVNLLVMPGLYIWLMLACLALLLRRGKYPALLLFVPALMNFLVCLASPLFLSMRYELPTIASMPLLLGWTRVWVTGKIQEK